MEGYIGNMRCIFVLVITIQLPLAMTLYEDLSHLCLDGTAESYKSAQPIISYNASPYPFVTKDTNVTLTCAARVQTPPEIRSYLTGIEYLKNGKTLHKCLEEQSRRLRNLSCNVTVSGVTNNDKFMCVIRATRAPCNAARLSFQVESPAAPNVSRLFATLKHDAGKMEITCIGTGIPEPDLVWLINGSMINYTSTGKKINAKIDTKLADLQNGTNVYRVNSKIVIIGRKFPLRIQCVVKNEIDKVYSENVYAVYVKVVDVKLTYAMVRWVGHPALNTRFLSVSGYNVSLKSGNEFYETIRIYKKSSVTFGNLTMGRAYTVEIETLTERGDLVIGAVGFYSPDKLPKPNHIYLIKIASRKAVIRWEKIYANKTIHGVLMGYNVVLIGKNRKLNIAVENDSNDVVLPDLVRKSNYTVAVRGFTKYGDGNILEYNFTTLDVIPAPQNVKIIIMTENSALVQWTVIEQHEDKFDKITGYTVTVRNETHSFYVKTSSDSSYVPLSDLSPNTNYRISVVGLSEKTQGIPSEWISFNTNDRHDQSLNNNRGENDEVKGGTKSTLKIVTLAVGIFIGAIIVLIAVAFIGYRRRGATKSQNITVVKFVNRINDK